MPSGIGGEVGREAADEMIAGAGRIIAGAWLAALGASPAAAQQPVCTVSDPTGTPLNVRTAPNSVVIGTLPNGAPVRLVQVVSGPDRKRWAFVVRPDDGATIGWIFRDYVICP
jgi:hypothetical protein